jgi:hypothetical protein
LNRWTFLFDALALAKQNEFGVDVWAMVQNPTNVARFPTQKGKSRNNHAGEPWLDCTGSHGLSVQWKTPTDWRPASYE